MADNARMLELAVEIASECARADVECCAKAEVIRSANAAEYVAYSLTEPVPVCMDGSGPKVTPESAAEDLRIVQRAAEFILLRGNSFPWRMVNAHRPGWVRFVDKEGRPLRPESAS